MAPYGHLDSAVAVGNSVVLTGWAFDRDSPSTSIAIAIYQDGKRLLDIQTDVDRPDVNSAYKITGMHGFKISSSRHRRPCVPGLRDERRRRHRQRLHRPAHRGGAGRRAAGHRLTPAGFRAAPAPSTGGRLESVTAAGNSVRLVGWLPDRGGRGRRWRCTRTAGAALVPGRRADPARRGRPAGFDLTIPAGTGLHTYAVYALAGQPQRGRR